MSDRDSDSAIHYGEISSGVATLLGVKNGLTKSAKMSFAVLGDRVYYCNGNENGVITNETTSSAWTYNTWTGPVMSDLGDDWDNPTTKMVATPVGSHIDVLSGRILLAVDDEIIFTEYGLPGLYNKIKNRRRFESDITMLRTVGPNATYVSDSRNVYFLEGSDPNQWVLRKVLGYPAIEWSDNPALVDPSVFGFKDVREALLFNTTKGLVIGLPDGTAINLTSKRYDPAVNCSAMAIYQNSLVVMSGDSLGVTVQGKIGAIAGKKAVTEWGGGYDTLLAYDDDTLIGGNDSGLFFLWGGASLTGSGLEMLANLEMLTNLEML